MKTVDIIANRYEWICPDCGSYYIVTEVTEKVTCRYCKKEFETNPAEHAYGK